jgi:uncharacterized protein
MISTTGATVGEVVRLSTATGTLEETLQRPPGRSVDWLALIIAGSGPTDRDGNTAGLAGHNDSLRLLAEGLAEHGIATLRYDKRGVGASEPVIDEGRLRFSDFVDDAVGWAEAYGAPSHHVAVIGHSEGSLVGMEAARRSAVDAFVSIAGSGRPADRLMMDQLARQLPPPIVADVGVVLHDLAAGEAVDRLPRSLANVPGLSDMFRPGVLPYLRSWFKLDPAASIASLSIPVEIIQGTTDLQVSVEEAKRLHTAAPGSQLVFVEGMNHVLKSAPLDPTRNIATYTDPGLPLAAGLVDSIAEFLASVPIPALRRV